MYLRQHWGNLARPDWHTPVPASELQILGQQQLETRRFTDLRAGASSDQPVPDSQLTATAWELLTCVGSRFLCIEQRPRDPAAFHMRKLREARAVATYRTSALRGPGDQFSDGRSCSEASSDRSSSPLLMGWHVA